MPRSSKIWDYIFGSGELWGLQTIKVDHLYGSLKSNRDMFEHPTLAHEFLGGIAEGAALHNVDVMFCMSYPNVLMQSVMYPAVTHARASADSHPSGNNFQGFAGESTWLWALGLWPFKDTFYSNATELTQNPNAGWEDFCRGERCPQPTTAPYCHGKYDPTPSVCASGRGEQLPFTHALIAALGGGGVAPGGVIDGAVRPAHCPATILMCDL